jgi:hypothetical protein
VILRRGVPARLGRPPTEDPRIDLDALVGPYLAPLTVALAAAILILLVFILVLGRRVGRLGRRVRELTRGEEGRDLGAVLDAHLDKVLEVSRELDEVIVRTAVVERQGKRAIQRIGLVRFNPFEDTGGNQSFALALLDGAGDGIVVSSLHSRSGTRLYAKAIAAGRAETALSEEEGRALSEALGGDAGRASAAV